MSSARRASHLARRRQSRFDRNRARIGRHYHQTALLPEPWGALELPVTFSAGHYEQQSSWFSQAVGGAGFMGGPLGGIGCGCPEGRRPLGRGGRLAYWQVAIAEETAKRIRSARRIEHLRHAATMGAHDVLHPEDDFLGSINCRSAAHRLIKQRVGDAAEAEDRAARAEDRRWPDAADANQAIRCLWRFGHETALALGIEMPPLPPDGRSLLEVWRDERRASLDG